ncbi:hypothetical protein TNCT_737701 [Trichonephila clavata]|uniref:Uncharacterized protein n=1 Tax=Trichonephila clavata TaxID=2740835 RepID=A0A8X6HJY9_TRICU|nr:hypothetical protein TNCT_228791 [Trichonephila clavata]GFR31424.1 hypothetical protein TNCT_737701 [Trichonephila clavata]
MFYLSVKTSRIVTSFMNVHSKSECQYGQKAEELITQADTEIRNRPPYADEARFASVLSEEKTSDLSLLLASLCSSFENEFFSLHGEIDVW